MIYGACFFDVKEVFNGIVYGIYSVLIIGYVSSRDSEWT